MRDYPSLWCKWVPTEDCKYIEWDGGDGGFEYWNEWLRYLIDKVLAPAGYVLNGNIHWRDDVTFYDFGTIRVGDNEVTIIEGVFPE